MALTRGLKETILARVQAGPKVRNAFLKEGAETLAGGDVDAGNAILRHYINELETPFGLSLSKPFDKLNADGVS